MLSYALLLAATMMLAPDTPTDEAKKELERIQGTWVATRLESGGQTSPAEVARTTKLVCVGDKYSQLQEDMVVEKGTHKLDPSKKPKAMDITVTEGQSKGELQLAIYELDGDILKICANEAGEKVRPKEFTTGKENGGKILVVLKREKKEEKKDEKKDEKK